MKQAVNFRLNQSTLIALAMLEKALHTSKTAIVEKAIKSLAKKEFAKQHTLLKFAGCLADIDADQMIANIKDSRKNKDLNYKL